jgi:SagB-type dehydrogenase family enzyme
MPQEPTLTTVLRGDKIQALYEASRRQEAIREAPTTIVICAVYERTAVKYGEERSPCYVHLEAGHAAQNILLQAVALGLAGTPIGAFYDSQVQMVLGPAS